MTLTALADTATRTTGLGASVLALQPIPTIPTAAVVVEALCRETDCIHEVAAMTIEVLRDALVHCHRFGTPYPIDDDPRFGLVYNVIHTCFIPGDTSPAPGTAHDLTNRHLLPQGHTFRHTSRDGVTRSHGCGIDCMTVEAAQV